MEYNKTKRGLEVAAAITALVYCIIDLILESIALIKIFHYIEELKNRYGSDYHTYVGITITGYIIGMIIGIALVAIELWFACKLIEQSNSIRADFINCLEIPGYNKKRIRIAFIVFSSILAFILLIGQIQSSSTAGGIIPFLIFATVIVLESVSMGMKDVKVENQARKEVAVTTNLSIEQKIAELKHLKELGVIDEEQYKNAVEKNIKEIL